MTAVLSGKEVAARLAQQFPESIIESDETSLLVKSDSLLEIVSFLKTTPGFDFNFLNTITAVDYFDYFEVVYYLTSMEHNHSLVIKTRCYSREEPSVASLVPLYKGADFQER
ncbi:MAG: NADH-quinone oxidoreductase subunit C, partial [Dehalococcoidia bacterium]|nr:NADH-quinone oxidoreductase subunit C [Dehalococcoidia bacterium]